MGMFIRCPSIPKKSNRNKQMRNNHQRQPILRLPNPILLGHINDDSITKLANYRQPDHRPNSQTQIRQSGNPLREPINLLKHDRKGREAKVQVGVIDAHEDGEGENDGGDEEEFEGTFEGEDEEM